MGTDAVASEGSQQVIEKPYQAPQMYVHYCEEPDCQKWGSFGYENHRTKVVAWFCFEHRDLNYQPKSK